MCVCQCVALAGFAQGVEFRDISFAGALKAGEGRKTKRYLWIVIPPGAVRVR